MRNSSINACLLAITISAAVFCLSMAFNTGTYSKFHDNTRCRTILSVRKSSDDAAEWLHHDIQYHFFNSGNSNRPAVLFCNGFRSSMNGNKALFLEAYCKQNGISYCRFDYRGHGTSCPDIFLDLTLTDWIQDTEHMLLNVVLKSHEKAILVGSSMGAWIALHVALRHPGKVTGIVGVASGIDFTESLYNSASGKQKTDWKTTGFAHFPSQYEAEPFPISCNFIRDAQETWLLLDKSSIPITCPVRLLHGQNDNDVSWQVSMKLNNLLESNNVVLILIKDGDHRLSRPQDLERMVACLDELLTLNNETRI